MESPAWRIHGNPDVVFWPKITLEVDGEHLTLDVLVRYKKDGLVHWFCLEIDEGAPTPASLHREKKLRMPVLRLVDREICREDFIEHLLARLEATAAECGPGRPESDEENAYMERAQRQARKKVRRERVRMRLNPSF